MDILTGLTRAMDYIEANICNDLDIDAIARVTPYSAYHLQKIFGYLTDISLAEYIRRRKMSLAAQELQNSKITELAYKYGYDSLDSFSRAFARLHGVTPSAAKRENTPLKVFPRLYFQISIKGDVEMNCKIVEMGAFNVVGVRRRFYFDDERNPQGIGEFWAEMRQNGTVTEILKHSDGKFDNAVGVCTNGDSDGLDYIICTATALEQAPAGLEIFTFPANTYAVFHFKGPFCETNSNAEKMIFSEWMPSSGYEPVHPGADLEVYSPLPWDSPDFEFWCYVPVKKRV